MNGMILDDAQLVTRVWDRDSDAFAELAGKYQRALFHLIRGLISNPEDAEDCAQEALLRTYRSMVERKTPDDPRKFWPFLRQIACNVVMDVFRRRDGIHTRTAELSRMLFAINDPIGDMELREIVEKLPRNERTVIWMYYLEGYGVDEIAKILGYRQPWVSKKKKRGETLLRKLWR
jgi:RNA polymerase sigma-70 factor (ECF subfamily)